MEILKWVGIGIGIIPAVAIAFFAIVLLGFGPGVALAGLSVKIKGRHDNMRESMNRWNNIDGSMFCFVFGWLVFLVGGASWVLDGAIEAGLVCGGIGLSLWVLGWLGA